MIVVTFGLYLRFILIPYMKGSLNYNVGYLDGLYKLFNENRKFINATVDLAANDMILTIRTATYS